MAKVSPFIYKDPKDDEILHSSCRLYTSFYGYNGVGFLFKNGYGKQESRQDTVVHLPAFFLYTKG